MNWILNLFKKIKPKDESHSLKNHEIFGKISFAKNVQVKNISVSSPAKRKMVERFLGILINDIEDTVKRNVEKDTSATEFMEDIYNLMTRTYEESAICSIPPLFIEKYKRMVERNMNWILNAIGDIATSTEYESQHDKIHAMLVILSTLIDYAIIDSEDILNNMNGELEKELKGSIYDK